MDVYVIIIAHNSLFGSSFMTLRVDSKQPPNIYMTVLRRNVW